MILEVSGLYKSYGSVEAVRGIDFYVEKGSLFAFLGPNGAGKSTTVDVICTFLAPDRGSVTVDGHVLGKDDDQIRSSIGVVFQDHLLDALLTVRENLELRSSFYGLRGKKLREAIAFAARAVGAEDFIDRPYGKLSGGQKRRADIARSLVNTPKLLFLDEPTTGLDPQTRKSVWDTVRRLQTEHGMTVFLTTHYMEEAANADYVAVIDEGRLTAKGTPAELRERYSTDTLKMSGLRQDELLRMLDDMPVAYSLRGDQVHVAIKNTLDALPILKRCEDHIHWFEVVGGSMDDAFIAITGKEIRE